MPTIPAHWKDVSWRNDMCPAFHDRTKGLMIWVDFEDVNLREWGDDLPRFNVHLVYACGANRVSDSFAFGTDDWAELLAFVDAQPPYQP